MTTLNNTTMRIKKQTIAKGLKKAMKASGIKVLRCAQNGMGALITIEGSIKNQEKAVKFFNEFDLFITGNLSPKVVNENLIYKDYGTLFNMQPINE